MMPPLDSLTPEEFEAVCDGCGKCCVLSPTQFACPGLDVQTRRCTVYEKRFDVHPCLKVTPSNVTFLHQQGALPDSCAYVRHEKGLAPLPVEPLRVASLNLAHPEIQVQFYRNADAFFATYRPASLANRRQSE